MHVPLLSRLVRDTGGGVTMIVAGGMLMMTGFAALAVDLGSIYVRGRELQGIADAAALAAAADPTNARTAAQEVIDANGWDDPVSIEVETGRYRFDTEIPVADRFVPSASSADSVRINLQSQAPIYFARFWQRDGTVTIGRAATASRARLASFSIGSRLAAVDAGLVGDYLEQLTGTSLNLSAMDYDALLDSDIDLLAFTEALATELDVTAVSFDEVLETDVSTPQALNALAAALDTDNQGNAANAIRQIATKVSGQDIKLSKLIDLGPYGAQNHTGNADVANASGYEFVQAMLQLADGQRQVKLDAGASIPGIADTDVWIAVGDRPADSAWVTITDNGETVIRTAQTRIYIEAKILGGVLGGVRLPLFVELAAAEAKLHDIGCGTGPNDRSVNLDVRPGVGHLSIADIDTAKLGDHKTPLVERPAAIVTTLLAKVSGQARVDVGGVTWQRVAFHGSDITEHRVKSVKTDDILTGVTQSLLTSINLTINPLGILPISTGPIASALGGLLAPLAGPLDQLLNTLTGIVGVRLGEADVRVGGVRCGQPALVA